MGAWHRLPNYKDYFPISVIDNIFLKLTSRLQTVVCLNIIYVFHFFVVEVGNLAQPIPKLDYFDEFQNLRTPAPSVEIHTFTIPGDGQFVMTANYVQNKGKTDPSVKR